MPFMSCAHLFKRNGRNGLGIISLAVSTCAWIAVVERSRSSCTDERRLNFSPPRLRRVCLFGVVALVISWVSLGVELAVSAVSQSLTAFSRLGRRPRCADESNEQPLAA